MQRNTAKTVKASNQKINAQVRTKTDAEVSGVGGKLLSGNSLDYGDIIYLAKCYAKTHGYEPNAVVVCKVSELRVRLDAQTTTNNFQEPFFVICEINENTMAVFCVVQHGDKIFCLYNDFQHIEVPTEVKSLLEVKFGAKVEFKVHAKIEPISKRDDSMVISLKTLETIMENMKADKRVDFIKNYANQKNPHFGWISTKKISHLKNEMFNYVKDGYYKTFASDIDKLARDVEFKRAIARFINGIPLLDKIDHFRVYQARLKEVAELDERDFDLFDAEKLRLLEEARKRVLEGTKSLNKLETGHTEKGKQQFDIEIKFPKQMQMFTKIFEPLAKSMVDDKLEATLEEICRKLDLDYTKLRSFFQTKESSSLEDDASGVQTCEDVLAEIAKIKFKSSTIDVDARPLRMLLEEIITEDTATLRALEEGYQKVKQFSQQWEAIQEKDVNRWCAIKKGTLKDSEIYEAIAVMDRANELVTGGHKLRDTQILSVLAFLQQSTGKGQLCQIQTGEGKTTIVSVLAAIKVLQGEKVDVVTSNPVLASDGVRDRGLFYSLLNVRVETNNADDNYKHGKRACYEVDIVYGSIGNFQFDFLKDSFLGYGTRARRPFENIILDEVDSMIIDNASHIAKLSGSLPGMENLKYVYIKIWMELLKAEKIITEELQLRLQKKAQELESRKIDDEEAQKIYDEFVYELQGSITPKMKELIKLSKPTEIDIIPSHIREYAERSLDRWIDSAINAKYNYCLDEQYVIRQDSKTGEEVIQPVDYANTGITMKNTIWQYGLHQFLQLKHGLHLTAESLTSCFISNLGYINKYGTRIFGLTGTLGSEAEQKLLASVYNVGFARIPTYKEKKFYEIGGEVVDDDLFGEHIAEDTLAELRRGRAVLIICETIKDAKTVREVLRNLSTEQTFDIRTFFDEDNAHITEQEIEPGVVVIATNIAGRGTDFRTTPELEQNGGLHVCVAFLPANKRVEDQAFGRTARQGNNGTGKLVVKQSEVDKLGLDSNRMLHIKRVRDEKEALRVRHIRDVKVKELEFQDKIFEQFSILYRQLKAKDQSDGDYQYVLDDLKEFWAFWLEKNDFLGSTDPAKEFNRFRSEAAQTIAGVIWFNPFYSIQQAEHFILNDQLDKAEQALNHALFISKNPEMLHSAYIKLFEVSIEKGQVLMDKFRKAVGDVFILPMVKPDGAYRANAKQYLKKTKEAFQKEHEYITQLFEVDDFNRIVENAEQQSTDNLFIKHLSSKHQTIALGMSQTESLIQQIDDTINETRGGICVQSRISDYVANLKPQDEKERQLKKTITNSELSELRQISANTTYSLRVVHDVSPEIVTAAQLQIAGGLILIASGVLFPPALPVTSSIGGTLITEGLCDIAIELISDGKFNRAAYIKGKVISYGTSLVTMGINAALQCPKILNAAKKACRWLSETLRSCPYFCKACEFLATKFDKLTNWFEKLETLAKLSKMSNLEKLNFYEKLKTSNDLNQLKQLGDQIHQLEKLAAEMKQIGKLSEITRFQACVTSLQQVAVSVATNVAKRTVEHVVMSKLVTPALSSAMGAVKPTLRKHVEKSVRETIDKDKLKYFLMEDIQTIIKEVRGTIDFGTVAGILKDSIMSLSKYCSNWRVQLCALAADQFISWKEVYCYVTKLCKDINRKLISRAELIKSDIEKLLHLLTDQFTEELYAQFISATVKTCKEVYSVGKSAYGNYTLERKRIARCLELNQNFREGGLAGQEQATALSDEIKRPIYIYDENGNEIVIGEQYKGSGEPIKVRYFPPDADNPTGHYVPLGEDKNWSAGTGGNNCLFEAVCSQTGQDPAAMRQSTVNRIDADPERYIAYQVHDIGIRGIFLFGGKKWLHGNSYPSHMDRIKVSEHLKEPLAFLRNDLNKQKKAADDFNKLTKKLQLTYIKHNKHAPTFGIDTKDGPKIEMMMGAMEVLFTDGSIFRIMTVSGGTPFSIRIDNISLDFSNSGTDDQRSTPYSAEFRGFRFVDPGGVDGKVVYDVYNHKDTQQRYPTRGVRNCARMKLEYELGNHMKNNPHLEIKGVIYMVESYYKPGTANFTPEQVIPIDSCNKCAEVMPAATGASTEPKKSG
ncbi:uncharacterized protein LOC129717778 [Wyeomyia smithii]|uniref:uncharacterized protein LOC129717778 n=1 Tax=Wyeomyia smithii TaxID=174621 RepID=UPI002467BBAF|nr:uncharacterized protein LOC129717778 [Wyeomyia smithii]XP_055523906.1 uncharacterized protein LOC129717778 [Wyeomyia smithii]XP_055523907.1 uncharacterized protein LOC129717778 [Wyeomyia smithii]XP_055523908.1 uncharacterized protein LOC129717778 [Wyeomyia smithii]XP_055523909.1 uncharacterized protein LOC129717778 [Wyeomyia smithii]XP_055523910.1 uncharacterized protein LOC129717778 [Wyeomyia smithii]XP_055523911.1 uncharacterized protein LOC129717778 [Wyeomyia smithii]